MIKLKPWILIVLSGPLAAMAQPRVSSQPVSAADLTHRVVVVRNDNSPISRAVADDYCQRRHIRNVLAIRCQDAAIDPAAETLPFAAFQKEIEAPLRVFLTQHPAIDFIVLTKGVPIRLADAPQGASPGRVSLDSFLAALDYEKVAGAIRVDVTDPNYGNGFHGMAWANRFWNSNERFSHARFGGYLVTRLDGYTEAEARALTTRSLDAERGRATSQPPKGRILIDICPGFGSDDTIKQPRSGLPEKTEAGKVAIVAECAYSEFNADMRLAAKALAARSVPIRLETTERFAGGIADLMGYVSWGSNDQKYDAGAYHSLGFVPGAIGETAVSTSARTFLPTQGGQSLIADLITQGITGVKGYTDEPLLQAIASPTILFGRYTHGWTLAESFYAASRLIGWQDVVIGDPLCQAYPGTTP